MAMPYTPFTRSDGDFWNFYFSKSGYKQVPPKTDPLPYNCEIYTFRGGKFHITNGGDAQGVANGVFTRHSNAERIRCYSKFVDAIGPRALGAVNLAERNQSLSMMANRTMQLVRFTRKLRRLDFVGAARELESPTPKKVSRHKSFANNWLEYHFGWEPLVKDIGAAIDFLQEPIKDSFVRARTHSMVSDKLVDAYGDVYYCSGTEQRSHQVAYVLGRQSCLYQASVAINNPNLYLANALGFVNPATVAWELVPFSFVIDWFTNVSQFLASGTDMLGLTLSKPFTSEWFNGTWTGWVTLPSCTESSYSYSWSLVRGLRTTGIALPSLGFRAPRILGWQRGLTAISLLLQQMKR